MPAPKRHVADAQTLRALAHPTRLALLDALRAEGELTASRAAELLDDSPGNMSWHLQTLAKFEMVEEAGTGKGRSRPWRLKQRGFQFDSNSGDAESEAAGAAIEAALIDRTSDQLKRWNSVREAHPDWAGASMFNSMIRHLTPAELAELEAQILELIDAYEERDDPSLRPAGTEAVRLVAIGHPLVREAPAPPSAGADQRP